MKQVSGADLAKALRRHGWTLLRTSGSHQIYGHADNRMRLSVPIHGSTPLKTGLLKHLMALAGLDEDDL